MEMKEREERRRNIVVREVKGGEREVRARVEDVLKEIKIEARVEGVRCLGSKEGGKGTAIVKIDEVEKKKEIMRRRGEIKGRDIRLDDDLTWRERRMRWLIESVARREREKGKRVWVGYGKVQINGIWWKWNEGEEELRDGEGRGWKDQGEE
ncbi:hypothetical protein ACS0PU_005342 [Formica fusca]